MPVLHGLLVFFCTIMAFTHWVRVSLQLLKIDMAVLQESKSAAPVTPPRRGSQQRVRILDMDNFIDTTNIEGRFEFSEYVRAYGKYLDEQLDVFAAIKFYQVHFCPCLH